jgi:hypothetical protein
MSGDDRRVFAAREEDGQKRAKTHLIHGLSPGFVAYWSPLSFHASGSARTSSVYFSQSGATFLSWSVLIMVNPPALSPRRPLGPASSSSRGTTSGTCFNASSLFTPIMYPKNADVARGLHGVK